jgi:hypothetical protein
MKQLHICDIYYHLRDSLNTSPPTASNMTPTPLLSVTSMTFRLKVSGLNFKAAHAPFSRTSEALSSVPQTPMT